MPRGIPKTKALVKMARSPNVISANLHPLHTGKNSELTHFCKVQTFKMHKTAVCLQSLFFESAVAGGFWGRESGAINLMMAVSSFMQ